MVNVAILGFGTVGSGVAEVLTKNSDNIDKAAAKEIRLKYILDVRDFPNSPYEDLFVKDFSQIENDPDVKVIVETIGGTKVAYDFTKRALSAGKSVVTSNKELVATKGHELLEIAKSTKANYLFEASVGGGIPIIRPITQCLAANRIEEIYGILNGTTNYILTQMVVNGKSYEEALKEAQEYGYAEQDPTADIEGFDACRKIAILGALCFGKHIYPEKVKTEGISSVTLDDVEYARRMGYKVKLLGRALRTGDNTATAYVAPHLINKTSLLSNVDDVFNGIVVHGNAIGEAMFYGPGAGKLPTASAVVADVIDAVKHLESRKYLDWEEGDDSFVTDSDELVSKWYVRCKADLETVGRDFGDVKLIEWKNAKEGVRAFVTDEMSGKEIKKRIDGVDILSVFRILD